ncbi:MAG: glycerol-3-phosphate 1-O-acyltransferase PlsB [Oligoflexales bacterium]|nr:glycerol-3-phosphate 1-O-acyltransferase PlsB [Oligoflexales bacterium]
MPFSVPAQIPEKNAMHFFWWLKSILYLWIRSKVFPKNPNEDLSLRIDQPICYVLASRSLFDLLILDRHCQQSGLPRPLFKIRSLSVGGQAAYLCLTKLGILARRREKFIPTALHELVEHTSSLAADIQIVPVSIFWGRNPGSDEKSIFKLLFFDDANGGLFQRFFTFFIQGRNVFCNFGKPISIKSLLDEKMSQEDSTKKLRRVLRVHFRKQRDALVGPSLYDRRHVIERVMLSKAIAHFIDQEVETKGKERETIEIQARRYLDEIAANMSYPVVRFFDRLLTWTWARIFQGLEIRDGEKIRKLAENYNLVYLPCHRSHMDYLLVGSVLYTIGLMPPHTAAGHNLSFWPAGPIIRRGGGFFIRRSFAGNRLYQLVFSEYVRFLIENAFPVCFYMEGGRSRTGHLLPPKTGMLSMVVHSFQKNVNNQKPLLLVPMSISYDRLMEAKNYVLELRGKAKKSESFAQMLRARSIFKAHLGKAYISFGEPLDLKNFLETQSSVSKTEAENIQEIASEIMRRINRASRLCPTSLFATLMLVLPKKAVLESELLKLAEQMTELLSLSPYEEGLPLPERPFEEHLNYVEGLTHFKRFAHPSGDLFYLDEQEAAVLHYYSNMSLPLLAVPSLIAFLFCKYQELSFADLKLRSLEIYPFLEEVCCLKWPPEQLDSVLTSQLRSMVQLGYLHIVEARTESLTPSLPGLEKESEEFPDKGLFCLSRPAHHQDTKTFQPAENSSEKFFFFSILGKIVGSKIARYSSFCEILDKRLEQADKKIPADAFEKECRDMSKRFNLLSEDLGQEEWDPVAFKQFVDVLVKIGRIRRQGDSLLSNEKNKST